MFKWITNTTTGEVTVGTEVGGFLVTERDTYSRMGDFLVGTDGDTLVKTGSHWTDTKSGTAYGIGSGFDDDDY